MEMDYEVIQGFLLLIGLFFGVPIIALIVHSIQFDAFKENFSKEGLTRHTKEYFGFLALGIILSVAVSKVKSFFTKKD